MNVVYLAPEVPGLSSTFVYKEIFALEELGVEITPVSIHPNLEESNDPALARLISTTEVLYSRKAARLVNDNTWALLSSPISYLVCFFLCVLDSSKYITKPRIAVGLLFRFFMAGSMVRDLRRYNADHIHAHFAHFPADIAMYAGLISKIPFSFTAHANDIFANHWLLREKVRRAKFVATISQYNIQYLARQGCDVDRIKLIRCGVNANDYPCLGTSKTTQSGSTLKLGFLGRLVEKKGTDVLLHACKILKTRGVDFQLEVLGDGPLKQDLELMARQLEITELVNFRGKVNNVDVFPWLGTIDMFVLPAQMDSQGDMDGIPVALMEAMLCNAAVVSTSLSGIPELVIHNETGLTALPGDAESLAECIIRLNSEPGMKSRLVEAAKKHVESEFNANSNAYKLMGLFNN